jgi:hypothetical protein
MRADGSSTWLIKTTASSGLPAGAVPSLNDLADAREGEVFPIELLTARDRAFDERDPCRRLSIRQLKFALNFLKTRILAQRIQ